MSLATEYTAAQDVTFIHRCEMAIIFFAVNSVISEPDTTPNHINRANLAREAVKRPSFWSPQMAEGVIALNQADDGSALSDLTINNSIATIWNMYAGVI